MKKFIASLLMCLMIWTIVDKYVIGSNNGLLHTYILENSEGDRKLYETKTDCESIFIVGDKVKFAKPDAGVFSPLERVK